MITIKQAIESAKSKAAAKHHSSSLTAEIRANLDSIDHAIASGVSLRSIALESGIKYESFLSSVRSARFQKAGLTHAGKPRRKRVFVSPLVYQEETDKALIQELNEIDETEIQTQIARESEELKADEQADW